MKGTGSERIPHGPVGCTFENIFIIFIQAEDKTSVDHDTQRMKPADGLFIILVKILSFITLQQVRTAQCFKSDEYTAHTGFRGFFNQVAAENGIDCGSSLKYAVHSLHSFEQRGGKFLITQQVVVQEVQVTPWQT